MGLLCLLSSHVYAATPVVAIDSVGKEPLSLTTFFDVLEDTTQKLTLADVRSPAYASQFKGDQPSKEALNYGFTHSAYWVRLNMHAMTVTDSPRGF